MFYVYLLRSKKDGMLYLGSTDDLRKRLSLHNTGHAQSTKSRQPFEIVYYEAYASEKDARMREHNLKLRRNAFAQLKLRLPNTLRAS